MSRQQFRLLVVVHQLLIYSALMVYEVTVGALPPDITQYLDLGGSVVQEEGGAGLARNLGNWLHYALMFATLVASLGLCLFKKWGRTLFLLCTVIWVLTSPVSEFYVSTGWSLMLEYPATLLEGMIIALAYFSHVRRLFTHEEEEAA